MKVSEEKTGEGRKRKDRKRDKKRQKREREGERQEENKRKISEDKIGKGNHVVTPR